MGLDGGIAFVPAERGWFKESPLDDLSARRSPVMRGLIRCGRAVFKEGSAEDLDIFRRLSGAREQTANCNCFPNCLFERRLTQLAWGLCSSQDRCLTTATYRHEYFSPAFAPIRVCNVSAGVIS